MISATKTVTPAFVSSATIDAATSEQEINKTKTSKHIRPRMSSDISDRRRPLSFYFITESTEL